MIFIEIKHRAFPHTYFQWEICSPILYLINIEIFEEDDNNARDFVCVCVCMFV